MRQKSSRSPGRRPMRCRSRSVWTQWSARRRIRSPWPLPAATSCSPTTAAACRWSATAARAQDPHAALAALALVNEDGDWKVERDLLASGRFEQDLVVEAESDGRVRLRFGDGVNGIRPSEGTSFDAAGPDREILARVGGGAAGNIGSESLARVVTEAQGIVLVRNPLPAVSAPTRKAPPRSAPSPRRLSASRNAPSHSPITPWSPNATPRSPVPAPSCSGPAAGTRSSSTSTGAAAARSKPTPASSPRSSPTWSGSG